MRNPQKNIVIDGSERVAVVGPLVEHLFSQRYRTGILINNLTYLELSNAHSIFICQILYFVE